MNGTLLKIEAEFYILIKNQAILILFKRPRQLCYPSNDHCLNVAIPNAVNNVQSMSMSNGQSIEAQTNIFSSTFSQCHHLRILRLAEYVR